MMLCAHPKSARKDSIAQHSSQCFVFSTNIENYVWRFDYYVLFLYTRAIYEKSITEIIERLAKINIPLQSIKTETSSLEDVFLDLTGKNINE